jgi:hypothetical protein
VRKKNEESDIASSENIDHDPCWPAGPVGWGDGWTGDGTRVLTWTGQYNFYLNQTGLLQNFLV